MTERLFLPNHFQLAVWSTTNWPSVDCQEGSKLCHRVSSVPAIPLEPLLWTNILVCDHFMGTIRICLPAQSTAEGCSSAVGFGLGKLHFHSNGLLANGVYKLDIPVDFSWTGVLILISQPPDQSGSCIFYFGDYLIYPAAAWFWSCRCPINQLDAWFQSGVCLIYQKVWSYVIFSNIESLVSILCCFEFSKIK